MSDLAILVPVLRRPHRVQPLLDSILAAKPAHVVFVCDPDDEEEIEAVRTADSPLWIDELMVPGGYARKINAGVLATREPFVFLGADDLDFRPGWFEAATARLRRGVGVVGTNDLCNPKTIAGKHATHFLVTREYAKRGSIDADGLLHEGYRHCFVDNELIATAKKRDAYAHASDSLVEHLHPMNGKAPSDPVYCHGMSQFHRDRRVFARRSHLWR